MNSKKQREPFFYILQPNIKFPEVNMQTVYSIKNHDKQKKSQVAENPDDNLDKKSNSAHDELEAIQAADSPLEAESATEIIESYHALNIDKHNESRESNKQGTSFNRVKRFKEMNTLERLDYLIHFPKQLPPVPCIFDSEGSSLRGILIGKTDDIVEIKLFNGKTAELSIESIKEVRMIGFKG